MEHPEYPMRINKYLAFKKYTTRRGGDELVAKRKVFINGRLAVLGDKVTEKDTVEIKDAKKPASYLYYAYNKPIGVITHSPQEGEEDIKSRVSLKDVFPIGRLDKNSHGLILLTNDGRVTDQLLNPEYEHEREYVVKTARKLLPSFKTRMEAGVRIEDYVTKRCKVEFLNDNTFSIILTEGKKHQIRRMCAVLQNDVLDLERVRIMNIELRGLKLGAYRPIQGPELLKFLKAIGL